MARCRALAEQLVDFLNASPSPFHAVAAAEAKLKAAGFVKISEAREDDFSQFAPGAKLYLTRNQTTLIAFAVGGRWNPGNGFSVVGAHTDSPVLRVKPISKVSALGFEQVGVETYGGGLWNTWFDRDLSVAGRAIVDVGGRFESRLVRIRKSILSIPSLAIHLNRSIYEEGFKPNFETHLIPILATQVKQALLVQEKKDEEKPLHNTLLLQMLAKELGVDVSQIRDFELSLYDTNPSAITGICPVLVPLLN
jgi:aspartyl aminopeptidase